MNKIITIVALAAVTLTSCQQRMSDVTKLKGKIITDGIESIHILVPEKLDTTIALTKGKFEVDLPLWLDGASKINVNGENIYFISDGTRLKLVVGKGGSTITSEDLRFSLNDRFFAIKKKEKEVTNTLETKFKEISAMKLSEEEKQEKIKEVYDDVIRDFVDYNKAVALNNDNILAVYALSSASSLMKDKDVLRIINKLSPHLQEHEYIVALKQAVEAKVNTAEGKMFVDFEVDHIYNLAKDGTPLTKKVKFSEYVGKGKYVVVDFWAPWCGPCIAEIPNLIEIYKKHKGDKFDMLSVAVWERQGPKVTLDTIKDKGLTWQQITNAQDIPTKLYGIEGIPHIMIVGPDGTIISRGIRGEELAEKVEDLLDD